MGKRLLDDSLLTSPSLAACSPRAQDAFPRMLLLADDFGCFDSNPRVLAGRGWPLRPDVTDVEIAAWLEEYRAAGMLQLWADGGRTYGHLLGWYGPHGQRRREEYSADNPKGSRRRTPAPPPHDANHAESLPAQFPPGKCEFPPGKYSFPPLHDQSHDQSQSQEHLAGADAPADVVDGGTQQNVESVKIGSGSGPRGGNREPAAQTPTPPANVAQGPAQALLEGLPEQSAKKSKRAKADEKPTSPHFKPLSDRLVAGYRRATGHPYVFQGAKDGAAVGRLCGLITAALTVEDLGRRFEAALVARFGPATGIADFAARPNDPRWGAAQAQDRRRGVVRAEDEDHSRGSGGDHAF